MGNNQDQLGVQTWPIVFQGEQFKVRKDKYGYMVEQYVKLVDNPTLLANIDKKLQARRISNNKHAVRLYGYRLNEESNRICGTISTVKIYCQRIVDRFSKYQGIPYQQALKYLSIMLKGYQQLSKEYGFNYLVDDSMLGQSQEGFLKVWINSDFSSVQPKIITKASSHQQQQSRLVQSILNTVIQKCFLSSLGPRHEQIKNSQKSFDSLIFVVNQILNIKNSTVSNTSPVPFSLTPQPLTNFRSDSKSVTRSPKLESNIPSLTPTKFADNINLQFKKTLKFDRKNFNPVIFQSP